jgi:hypothetical protein
MKIYQRTLSLCKHPSFEAKADAKVQQKTETSKLLKTFFIEK